ncbi:solute carrier family 46 member 2-like [Brachionichthys hirsutus]|uniref:solute carrier family 46 member 2-like n=1 Tax=Brachionichthys hirsutus TaxID=412623 RepID=UPI0036054546
MICPSRCEAVFTALRRIEPSMVLELLGRHFFDTALLMVVKDRSANATYPDADLSREESQQKAMSDFYMIYKLIFLLTGILPSLLLAKIGDRGWRRVPIVVSLGGSLMSTVILLLVVLFRLPLEVMFGAAALFGLSGGFAAFWSGVMTLASLGSTPADRSKVLMRVELLYGITGLVGSLVSGHLFQLDNSNLGKGTLLLSLGTLMNLLCFLHSALLLQVKQVTNQEPEEDCQILSQESSDATTEAPAGMNKVNMALLFTAAALYVTAVGGAMEILSVFVMKAPLSWTAAQVGYEKAAGCMIFITSFLGVVVFRRCVSESVLIMIGMVSFASGIFFMSFVTETYMFYLARSLNMFALIPMATIRSLLSQQVPASSCGITLTSLQVSLRFAGLAYIPAFTKIYQKTLSWFPGFIFTLSATITVLAMIPISIFGCRSPQRREYDRIQGE